MRFQRTCGFSEILTTPALLLRREAEGLIWLAAIDLDDLGLDPQ